MHNLLQYNEINLIDMVKLNIELKRHKGLYSIVFKTA